MACEFAICNFDCRFAVTLEEKNLKSLNQVISDYLIAKSKRKIYHDYFFEWFYKTIPKCETVMPFSISMSCDITSYKQLSEKKYLLTKTNRKTRDLNSKCCRN